ncbi:DeoR/GlpR family DNA-binding transcription regulator [Paenibacillus xerothermodurans]|uniref:DeoR/GlpR transcriptional regulator n=1 Tax=Paenibacillus xerothermodurans TaxID=1977292 RepID=A0A2W1NCD8_PAEXE|nr:DeoR/GlpR family DNA-binding transcription regulator [Paenibacillus xerothermodurans]PZE20721.1 DeoR/GlpR transcriptional regulator [Paenibacillus xerothermodurans]
MLPEVRQSIIIDMLNSNGSVKVAELSQKLQVTEKTIRDDLEKLDKRGILKKVHGGAVLGEEGFSMLPIFGRRQRQQEEKEQIAARALDLVEDGHTLLLDAGSTTYELAKLLKHLRLTVITNDTKIAAELAESSSIELCVLGGFRRKGTFTIADHSTVNMMKEYNTDIAFIGCTGIDLQRGLSLLNREETELKKQMLLSAKKKVLLADFTKFGRTALVSFAAVEDIDLLITDNKAPADILRSINAIGVKIVQ